MPNKKTNNKQIAIFEGQKIRRHWDEKKELWHFAILKNRLKQEGSEVSEKIGQLKMQAADGKFYLTN